MGTGELLQEIRGNVGTLTINRPEKANSPVASQTPLHAFTHC
jgi:enoyl-CoA hydratase/carnithine racemase